MQPAIYKFTNKVNGKIYIGQTHSITTRFRDHLRIGDKCPFKDDVLIYKISSFKFEVLEFIENGDNIDSVLNEREQFYIDIHIQMGLNFDTMFYNDVLFVETGGCLKTEEQRKHMSEAKIGSKLSIEHLSTMSKSSKERNSAEHLKKYRPSGLAISLGQRKNIIHVLQYDLDGNFIAEHETQIDAATSIGKEGHEYNINKALRGVMYQAFGYQWRYYTDNFPKKIKSILRKVRVLNYTKEEIGVYNSPIDAAKAVNIHVNRVIYALNDSKYGYSGGYYFCYANNGEV